LHHRDRALPWSEASADRVGEARGVVEWEALGAVDWRSFFVNDLPLITTVAPEVRDVAAREKLNKSQTKAMDSVAELFSSRLTHDLISSPSVSSIVPIVRERLFLAGSWALAVQYPHAQRAG
jgi:hypothetical protein